MKVCCVLDPVPACGIPAAGSTVLDTRMVTNTCSSLKNDELTNYSSLFDEIFTKFWKFLGWKFEKIRNFLKNLNSSVCQTHRFEQNVDQMKLKKKDVHSPERACADLN